MPGGQHGFTGNLSEFGKFSGNELGFPGVAVHGRGPLFQDGRSFGCALFFRATTVANFIDADVLAMGPEEP
jgi:hypothetical protein